MAMQPGFRTSDKFIAITCVLSGKSIASVDHEIDPRGKTRVFFAFDESARDIDKKYRYSSPGEPGLLFDVREMQRVSKEINHIINDYRAENGI